MIEDRDIMFRTAEHLKGVEERTGVPIIYKASFTKDNRSSLEYYQGPGLDEGLKLLQSVKEQFDMPIVSDIHSWDQAEAAGEVLDIIQIPAYLCMQSSLHACEAVCMVTSVNDPIVKTAPIIIH